MSGQRVCERSDGPVRVARCTSNLRRSLGSGFCSIHITGIETGHEINGSNPGKFTLFVLFDRRCVKAHKWENEKTVLGVGTLGSKN